MVYYLHHSKGMAQGSPLSPPVFAVAIEPLALAAQQNQDIKGTMIVMKQYKVEDDILLTLTDPANSKSVLIECVEEFGQISRYKDNWGKSEINPPVRSSHIEPSLNHSSGLM